MWRNLGANLTKQNAERTAGTLGVIQLVYYSVDRDCYVKEQYFGSCYYQVIADLLINVVSQRTPSREGYGSFPKFQRSILHGLDYRDLHKWPREHIDLWGSIYQQER